MPGIGNGLKTAITGPILGFLASATVSAILPEVLPGSGSSTVFLFNLFSIIASIVSLQNAKYWGLMYSVGYFFGLTLIGRYFMESWEYPIYILVIGFYISLKITRKL